MNDELERTPAMIQRQQEIKDFLMAYAHPSDVPTYWEKPDQTTAAIIWELLVKDFRIKSDMALYFVLNSVFFDMLVLDPVFVGHYTAEHWALDVLWDHGIASEVDWDTVDDLESFVANPMNHTHSGHLLTIDGNVLKPLQESEEIT